MIAHAQKPYFVFRRNGRDHLIGGGVSSVYYWQPRYAHQLLLLVVVMLFRGSEKGTGYPLHSPVSPSLPVPCVTVCHHISTGVYCQSDAVPYYSSACSTQSGETQSKKLQGTFLSPLSFLKSKKSRFMRKRCGVCVCVRGCGVCVCVCVGAVCVSVRVRARAHVRLQPFNQNN